MIVGWLYIKEDNNDALSFCLYPHIVLVCKGNGTFKAKQKITYKTDKFIKYSSKILKRGPHVNTHAYNARP